MPLSIQELVESCRFDLKPPYSIVVKAIAKEGGTSNAEAIRQIIEIAFGPDLQNAPPEAQQALAQYQAIIQANEQASRPAGPQAGGQRGKQAGGRARGTKPPNPEPISRVQPPDQGGESGPPTMDDLFFDQP